MIFVILTVLTLIATLVSRKKRGNRISVNPRRWERLVVLNWKGRMFHIHHAYWGIVILPLGYFSSSWLEIGLALIVSDILFHITAHLIWNDPIWD